MRNMYWNLKFRPSEKIIMTEVSGHMSELVNVINVFHDVNLVLYTVTNIHPKVGILLSSQYSL